MLALNRFSDTFYLVFLKHLFIPLISPPGYEPPPPPIYKVSSGTETPYEVIKL